MRRLPGIAACFFLVSSLAAFGQEWPSFRGPGARGVADGQDLPADWDVKTGRNVRWKTAVPGVGHSSPVVWGDRIFLTTAVPAEPGTLVLGDKGGISLAADKPPISWRLLCLDARDGKTIWEREAHAGAPRAARHVKSSQANPTPATDGRTVVALFGSGTLVAYGVDGTRRFSVDLGTLNPGLLGDPKSEWGHASSPVIFENLAIVQVDKHAGSFLAAYDLASGKPVWRVEREERPVWATPTLHLASGRTELLVVGGLNVRGYDPRTGKELWRFKDEAEVKTPTPFVADGLVIFAGGYRGRPIYAIREGASGDVSVPPDAKSGPSLAWRTEPGGPYTTTPLAYRDLLYAVRDEGVLGVYELKTGALLYRERTGTTHSASPIGSDGKVYLPGEDGQLLVLRAGRAFEVLARIDMGETVFATPAIARGTLYVRTRCHLYAIGKQTANRQTANHKRPRITGVPGGR
jgi:outer membrane protein assembly factor BamB